MLMVMQPNTPPAPPPVTPVPPQGNPYDFIVNPNQQQKKKLGLPSTGGKNDKLMRVVVILVAVVILITLAGFVMNLLGSSQRKNVNQLVTVAQKQTELIRVSEIGIKKARTNEAKNLAITTQLTLTSQQAALSEAVKKAGGKLENKTLALGKDTKTDQLLTQAEQSNNFDAVFLEKLKSELTEYAQSVKKAYDSSSSKKTKQALEIQFNNAATLADFKKE
jgi:hypothetical protein